MNDTPQVQGSPRSGLPANIRAILPALVCAGLALGPMQRWPMWNDETFTWGIAQGSLAQTMKAVVGDVHPPLYFLLTALIAPRLADQDEAWRVTAVIATVLAIPFIWYGARRIAAGERSAAGEEYTSVHLAAGGRAEGIADISTWIVATNPAVIAMAVSARQYGQLLLAGALVFSAGAHVIFAPRRNPRWARSALGLAVAIALYTHYAGIAVVLGLALGGTFALLGRADGRTRFTDLFLGLAAGGLLFLPWALGPMATQLAATAGEATPRNFGILRYLFWSPDEASPALCWLLALTEATGLAVMLRKHRSEHRFLLGFVAAGLLIPYALSSSPRSARTRNFMDLLPAAALIASIGADYWIERLFERIKLRFAWTSTYLQRLSHPLVLTVLFVGFAVPALRHMASRPVSPEIGNLWRDIKIDGDVLEASIPSDAHLAFRPYFLSQYDRYAPGLRTHLIPRDADLAKEPATTTWIMATGDTVVPNKADYPKECVFVYAFEWVVYAAPGPGCDALQRWIVEVSDAQERTTDYVPFLVERGVRARDAGKSAEAESLLSRAAARIHGYSEPARLLAQVRLDAGDAAGAITAATRAVNEARENRLRKGLIQSSLATRAAAHDALGHSVPAAADRRAIACAETHSSPWRCGSLWEFIP